MINDAHIFKFNFCNKCKIEYIIFNLYILYLIIIKYPQTTFNGSQIKSVGNGSFSLFFYFALPSLYLPHLL